jgi:hypothetical protein
MLVEPNEIADFIAGEEDVGNIYADRDGRIETIV